MIDKDLNETLLKKDKQTTYNTKDIQGYLYNN